MREDGKITNLQFIYAILLSRLILTLAYLPFFETPPKNQDLWIAVLLSFPLHILLSLPSFFLARRFSNQTIIQTSEEVLGKAGKIIGSLYVWVFLHRTAIVLREFGEFLTAVPYPSTPIIVFIGSMAIISAYAVSKGLETIMRFSEVAFPLVIISITLVLILLTKDMDFQNLQPVFSEGFTPILLGSFIISSRTFEISFILMLIPFINRKKQVAKSLIIAFFIISLVVSLITIAIIAVFGVEQASRRVFAFLSLVRLISIGDFFERIDALHIALWILGMFFKATIYYYMTLLSTSELFGFKDYRFLILPIGAMIVTLSIIQSNNIVDLENFTSYETYTWYNLFFMFLLPLLILIFSIVTEKREDTTL